MRGGNGRQPAGKHEPHSDLPTRLKSLRRSKGLTLATMAGLVGVTKGFLSQVENGAKGPSIPTLLKIASALDTPISYFFNAEAVPTGLFSIVRAHERRIFERSGTAYDYRYEEIAFKKKHKRMEPLIVSPPHKAAPDQFQHTGEEMLLVLKGKIRLELGKKEFVLRAGDCAYYDGATPHRTASVGRIRALAVLVVSYETSQGASTPPRTRKI
jgi:transcriptional regulator with XRE-family HTH domain